CPAGAGSFSRRRMTALPGNLDGIRVLDLTREPGLFAGKLLGDLGADVVMVEPPAGDPARRHPPFWDGLADPARSLLWLGLATSTRPAIPTAPPCAARSRCRTTTAASRPRSASSSHCSRASGPGKASTSTLPSRRRW